MKKIVLTIILTIVLAIPAFSASEWYSEGYTWAKDENIISSKTKSQLFSTIKPNDFYVMIFKYFDLKGFYNPNDTFFKMDDYKSDNYILVATERQLSAYIQKEWLTNDEYKKISSLIDNARNVLEKNVKYFESQELESINYYLDMMEYLLYNNIYDYQYKSQIYVKKPKNADKFIEYKLIPYYGLITREEFLNLIYYYDVSRGSTFSTGQMVGYYRYNNILLGYNNNLMLNEYMNYAHFVTFLIRM